MVSEVGLSNEFGLEVKQDKNCGLERKVRMSCKKHEKSLKGLLFLIEKFHFFTGRKAEVNLF